MEQQDLYTEYRKHLKERILTVAMQAFKQHGIRNVRMDRHRNNACYIKKNDIRDLLEQGRVAA